MGDILIFKEPTSMSKNFEKITKTSIKERTLRQKVYEHSQNVLVWTRKKHFPAVTESQLMKKSDVINPDITFTLPARLSFDGNEFSECEACFNHSDLVKLLSLHNFDLLQLWLLDIPLDIQIILDKFVNRDSFYSRGDKIAFLLSKMERLYGAYDILRNTFNKNCIGIQANTDELAMHFQSIPTVFSTASNTGISTSLVTVEKKIKEKATDDLCYYNTDRYSRSTSKP
ncbi:unnamed protein product [Mytilus coruscus]|uniref:Uncharacterized protein n=1 Tax=Mytilus coruscus TaxID=42192 RepID=A0A6J8CGX4_MYTCO|nr:unnamed protein product [Mytilus coruscus]